MVHKAELHKFLETVVIPYSQSEGYKFCDSHQDYLVGSLARLNYNKDLLNIRTKTDTEKYLKEFPSMNLYHNNLAQAIEILQCVDDAIDLIKNINIKNEKPIKKSFQAGQGVGVVEAPRGLLYHMVKVTEKGLVENYEVVVPTSQNQISIENDLRQYFNENLDKDEDTLHLEAEKIVRAYDPCMSCATNFLKIDWIRK
jgi:coenzyme F420-reducing hydrogenase alpha subunit